MLTVNRVALSEACAVYCVLACDAALERDAALSLLRGIHVALGFDDPSHLVLPVVLAKVASGRLLHRALLNLEGVNAIALPLAVVLLEVQSLVAPARFGLSLIVEVILEVDIVWFLVLFQEFINLQITELVCHSNLLV